MAKAPWGKTIVRGIVRYSTASHGGYHVSPKLNALIHPALRFENGRYEEDCEWARVEVSFPQYFPDTQEEALQCLKAWNPDAYEAWSGVILQPGESHTKDRRLFLEAHKNDYLVLSAYGSWHEEVPEGFVGVYAGKGGRTPEGSFPDDTAYFLVLKEFYKPDMVLDAMEYGIKIWSCKASME